MHWSVPLLAPEWLNRIQLSAKPASNICRYTGKAPELPRSCPSPTTRLSESRGSTAAAAVNPGPTDPYASRERHHNEGHGRRLTAAFEALEAFPVLAESRNRVMRLFEEGDPATADVVAAVEADVALAVAVLRLANQVDGRMRGRVDSAVTAR